MKISVRVKAQAKQDKLEKAGGNSYKVWVKAKAIDGRANQAVVKLLAEYFDVAKSGIILLKGAKSRDKVFAVGRRQ